ncbi:TetR/AcrR family transcriptional regulator [Paenibacillus eucommiae]|uniref:AcrR family transcriptional regulator n=1 Tax=Paenibacillus eucommiae TaxID=1355755 RepID=A0ABS4ISD8_9BACL|nr:TetR-like C-terminal domain-containing protein [Paenibacillus eucommiae]MBP1990483.1 AcrR family transcriptional regulator [Paenibacillus eucommiae]
MAKRPGIDKAVILQNAVELADTEGFEQVTLGAIALRLNIKTPSLYNHIDGLPGLRRLLCLHGLEQLRVSLIQETLGKSGDEALFALGIAYVGFVRRHPGLYEATMVANTLPDQEIKAAGEEIVRLLLLILSAYKLEEAEALHTVRGLRSIAHGFATLEAKGGFAMQLDRDESLRHLLQTYVTGMRHSH